MLVLFPVSPFSTQNVFWSFVAKIHPTPNTKPTVHLPRKQSTIPQARHHSLHGPVSQQILHSSLLLSHQLELTCCTLHAILFHFLFIFNSSIHPFNPPINGSSTHEGTKYGKKTENKYTIYFVLTKLTIYRSVTGVREGFSSSPGCASSHLHYCSPTSLSCGISFIYLLFRWGPSFPLHLWSSFTYVWPSITSRSSILFLCYRPFSFSLSFFLCSPVISLCRMYKLALLRRSESKTKRRDVYDTCMVW